MSTDTALQHVVKQFLCVMGQGIDQEALQSVLLPLEEIERRSTGGGNEEETALLTESNAVVSC